MPVPQPNFPIPKVEMSFVDNPLGADPYDYVAAGGTSPVGGWIDVTDDVRSASVDRGRNNDLSKVDAGTASVVLDNRTRKYDPLNQSSVYWDSVAGETLLKPRRQIKISGAYPNDVVSDELCYDLVSGNSWEPYTTSTFTTRGLTTNALLAYNNPFGFTAPATRYGWRLSVHAQPVNGTWDTFDGVLASIDGVLEMEVSNGFLTVTVFQDTGFGVYRYAYTFEFKNLDWVDNDNKPLWFRGEFWKYGPSNAYVFGYVAPSSFDEPDNDWEKIGVDQTSSFFPVVTIAPLQINNTVVTPAVVGGDMNIKRITAGIYNSVFDWEKNLDLLTDTHINIFQGYTQGFPQNFSTFGDDATVDLQCFDMMGLLGNMTTTLDYVEQIVNQTDAWGWWRLGDNADVAVDSSGNAHDLVYRNKLNQSANIAPIANGLNGVGTSFINVGNNRPRVNSGHRAPIVDNIPSTLMGWFVVNKSLTSSGATIPIVEMWDTNYSDRTIAIGQRYWINENGSELNEIRVTGKTTTTAFTCTNVGSSIAINDGQPHHFAVRMDSVVRNKVDVFLDGKLYASYTYSGKSRTGGSITIGSIDTDEIVIFAGGSGGTFDGIISDVIFLDQKALDDTEIFNVYKAGLGYDSETSSARLDRIASFAGIPSRLTAFDYSTSATCGALDFVEEESVVALMQKVEDTEQGILYTDREGRMTLLGRYYLSTQDVGINVQALFSDDETDSNRIPYRGLRFSFDGDQLANDHIIEDDTNAQFQYTDDTSVTEYGKRTRRIKTLLDDTESARQMAIGLTNIYKNPLIKAEEFEIVALKNNWLDVLPLDIGFRVELRVTPMNTGAEIDQELALQRIRYEIQPKQWNTFVSASPRPVVSYFVLDKSELDGPDVLGF